MSDRTPERPAACGVQQASAGGYVVTCDQPAGHGGMHSGPRALHERYSWAEARSAASVPPFFDRVVPERACSRAINESGDPCGGDPFLHVAWADTPEGVEAGWVCTRHASELSTHWPPIQTHEPGPDCGMPGALWFFDENVCRCPESDPAEAAVAEREEVLLRG